MDGFHDFGSRDNVLELDVHTVLEPRSSVLIVMVRLFWKTGGLYDEEERKCSLMRRGVILNNDRVHALLIEASQTMLYKGRFGLHRRHGTTEMVARNRPHVR